MDNKARTWFVLISCIIVAVIAFAFGAYVYNKKTARNDEPVNIEKLSQVEEIKENSVSNEIETSTSESKVSPNAIVNEKRYYKKCDHLIRETVDIPEELVNMSEEDVKKYYTGWNIEKYTPTEITIYKEFSGICNEHYIVKKNGDVLGIYIENDDGVQEWLEDTQIEVQYLPEEDIKNFEVGVKVVGKTNLNLFLEDYE